MEQTFLGHAPFNVYELTCKIKYIIDTRSKIWILREMDLNERKFLISFVPYRGYLLETVIYNRIRHFGDTFKHNEVIS